MVKINKEELNEIFQEIKADNGNAYEQLYDKYNKLLYAIAFSILKNKEDSEDTVQNIFTKIYNIDKSKLPTENEACWLYTITKNEAITLLRKKCNSIDLDSIYEMQEINNEIDEIISKESYNRLISKINKKDQEIISLKILSDMSFSEIAELLNEPISTIKWRYYKSIKSLKLILSNLGMFIITFIIGLKVFLQKEKYTNQEIVKDDEFSSEIKDEVLEENKSEDKELNSTINGNEFNKNEVIVETKQEMNEYYVEIGIFSVSAIGLIITIIFSILYTKNKFRKKSRK